MSAARALRLAFRVFTPIHVWLYRSLGGRIVGRVAGSLPVLLLTTVGRRSGRRHTAPLGYVRDGEGLIVIGSSGGHPRHPDWALNLRAHPDAEVRLGREVMPVRAEWTEGAERERLWRLATARYPFYEAYQKRAGRVIPVVKLTPRR